MTTGTLSATDQSPIIQQGPAGSNAQGTAFEILPQTETSQTRIKRLRVKAGWAVDSVQVEYENLDGTNPYLLSSYGGSGGHLEDFIIDAGDYLTKITGTWGRQAPGYPKEEIISLQFETHKGVKSPVFGGGSGQAETESFVLEAPENYAIVGLFGQYGNILYQLGIYLQLTTQGVTVGPVGGSMTGQAFDFHPKDNTSRLTQVGMMAGWAIGTLEVHYESSGETYGFGPVGSGGGQKGEVALEAGDYLTKVMGTWGRQAPGYPKQEIISLQFETHKGVKSPVFGGGSGQAETESFVLEAPENHAIVGFFGYHGGPQDLLLRLGVYCQVVSPEEDSEEDMTAFVEGETTGTAIGTVAIAEIFHKGQVKRTQADEYIEIVNQGNHAVDISAWTVTSGGSRRQTFSFPANTMLEAGQRFRVYTNETHPETGGFSFDYGTAIWNDQGDEGKLFDAQGTRVSTFAYGVKSIPGIQEELEVPHLTVKASPWAVNQQMQWGGEVTFSDALRLAIGSFLEDSSEIESPLGQILNDPESFGLSYDADKAAATNQLRAYLNQGTLTLLTATSPYPPEKGESIESNWIFLLQLADLSGLYWAVIDRSGTKAAYNYGVS